MRRRGNVARSNPHCPFSSVLPHAKFAEKVRRVEAAAAAAVASARASARPEPPRADAAAQTDPAPPQPQPQPAAAQPQARTAAAITAAVAAANERAAAAEAAVSALQDNLRETEAMRRDLEATLRALATAASGALPGRRAEGAPAEAPAHLAAAAGLLAGAAPAAAPPAGAPAEGNAALAASGSAAQDDDEEEEARPPPPQPQAQAQAQAQLPPALQHLATGSPTRSPPPVGLPTPLGAQMRAAAAAATAAAAAAAATAAPADSRGSGGRASPADEGFAVVTPAAGGAVAAGKGVAPRALLSSLDAAESAACCKPSGLPGPRPCEDKDCGGGNGSDTSAEMVPCTPAAAQLDAAAPSPLTQSDMTASDEATPSPAHRGGAAAAAAATARASSAAAEIAAAASSVSPPPRDEIQQLPFLVSRTPPSPIPDSPGPAAASPPSDATRSPASERDCLQLTPERPPAHGKNNSAGGAAAAAGAAGSQLMSPRASAAAAVFIKLLKGGTIGAVQPPTPQATQAASPQQQQACETPRAAGPAGGASPAPSPPPAPSPAAARPSLPQQQLHQQPQPQNTPSSHRGPPEGFRTPEDSLIDLSAVSFSALSPASARKPPQYPGGALRQQPARGMPVAPEQVGHWREALKEAAEKLAASTAPLKVAGARGAPAGRKAAGKAGGAGGRAGGAGAAAAAAAAPRSPLGTAWETPLEEEDSGDLLGGIPVEASNAGIGAAEPAAAPAPAAAATAATSAAAASSAAAAGAIVAPVPQLWVSGASALYAENLGIRMPDTAKRVSPLCVLLAWRRAPLNAPPSARPAPRVPPPVGCSGRVWSNRERIALSATSGAAPQRIAVLARAATKGVRLRKETHIPARPRMQRRGSNKHTE